MSDNTPATCTKFFILFLLFICSTKSVSAEVPEILYHSGKKIHLFENIKNKSITDHVWKNFIMKSTNFKVPSHRRGLYGSESLSDTSLYIYYPALEGVSPWTMKIHVAPHCRNSAHIYDGVYTWVPNSSYENQYDRFGKWYQKNQAKFKNIEDQCFQKMTDYYIWDQGDFFSEGSNDPNESMRSKTCSTIIEEFYNQESLWIIADNAQDNSWYIRNSSCVKAISGTANEHLEDFTNLKAGIYHEDFLKNFFGDTGKPGTTSFGGTLLILEILAEIDQKKAPGIAKLTKLLEEFQKWNSNQPKDKLSFFSVYDHPDIISALLESYIKSVKTMSTHNFQNELKNKLNNFYSLIFKHCYGPRGIPHEKRQNCEKNLNEFTQNFLHSL